MVDEITALLIRARGFVQDGWCRGTAARNTLGIATAPRLDDAREWCAWGALRAAGWPYEDDLNHPAYRRLLAAMDGNIVYFNDTQETVEPVLAAFDRAISAGSS